MRGTVEAMIVAAEQGLCGPTITLQLPGDSVRFVIPVAAHQLPSGRVLQAGDIVVLNGDREGASEARLEGQLISARDFRTRRAWRPIKPRR